MALKNYKINNLSFIFVSFLKWLCSCLSEQCNSSPSFQWCEWVEWYHDVSSGVCKQYPQGKCGGNENSFNSKMDCEVVCHGGEYSKVIVFLFLMRRKNLRQWRRKEKSKICQKWHVIYQNYFLWLLNYRTIKCLLFTYLFAPNKNIAGKILDVQELRRNWRFFP